MLFSRSTNPEDPGGERKSSQPTLTLTPENAALLPSGSSDAACSPIQEEGGELTHREGGHLSKSESEGEDPSEVSDSINLPLCADSIKSQLDVIVEISEKKHDANMELMAEKEFPYGPKKNEK